jgi:hypothetical protein
MTDNPSSGSTGPGMPNFQVRIPLEWSSSADTPILYANQVMVSHAGPEFFLVFGVVLPPESPDQIPDSLTIEPQVRVVVAREAMPAIVQALADNWQRFRSNAARMQAGPPNDSTSGKAETT